MGALVLQRGALPACVAVFQLRGDTLLLNMLGARPRRLSPPLVLALIPLHRVFACLTYFPL